MDRMLYIGMTGAKESLLSQAVNSHNLANISTTGFKAELAQFRSMPVYGDGHPSRAFSMTERAATDFSPGPLESTGRPLDMAISGDGWIAIQNNEGVEAYTRAGNLSVSPEGFLLTASGYRVLGASGPVSIPPAENMNIGNDGTITIRQIGQRAATLAVVDRIKLVNPDSADLKKGKDGLMYLKDGEIADNDLNVKLISGVLERSNVSAVDAMVTMISLARNYEMQIKIMATAKENDEATAKLMRIS